jgi:hypothetical protein
MLLIKGKPACLLYLLVLYFWGKGLIFVVVVSLIVCNNGVVYAYSLLKEFSTSQQSLTNHNGYELWFKQVACSFSRKIKIKRGRKDMFKNKLDKL